MAKYKVLFEYDNERGEVVKDYFNRGGRGFTYDEAKQLAARLREFGHRHVTIKML